MGIVIITILTAIIIIYKSTQPKYEYSLNALFGSTVLGIVFGGLCGIIIVGATDSFADLEVIKTEYILDKYNDNSYLISSGGYYICHIKEPKQTLVLSPRSVNIKHLDSIPKIISYKYKHTDSIINLFFY